MTTWGYFFVPTVLYVRCRKADFQEKTKNHGILKRNDAILLGGVAVAAGAFLLRKASAAGHLVFSPGNVTSMDFVGSTPTLTFQLIVQNTSGSDLLLNSLAGNLSSNGYLIGNVNNFSGVPIMGNSSTTVLLTVSLQVIGIVNDLIRAFQYKNFTQDITLDGAANVNGFQVPLNLKFSVGG